ncbi:hypothetical protein [Thermogemmatispora carboxidivorans]|uniref:hypothetical protein n=1 Tax=Thermogemmatispora carboxidivorans TaxID=1382306 RepID=UPI00069AF284|nr:hypothetical protein [Thermogemmatispora carboxidivorans]
MSLLSEFSCSGSQISIQEALVGTLSTCYQDEYAAGALLREALNRLEQIEHSEALAQAEEVVREAWDSIETALAHLDLLPAAQAWQLVLAPFFVAGDQRSERKESAYGHITAAIATESRRPLVTDKPGGRTD